MSLLLSGCKSTKFISDDNYLLRDIDIKIDNDNIEKEELASQLRQKENLKILGLFKFHLGLYNLSNKSKEKGLLKRVGEPPVVYDIGLKDKSVQQLKQYLFNKGYYRAQVTDIVELKNKKANIIYEIKAGEPYLMRNVDYEIFDHKIAELINDTREESLLQPGNTFDVDILEKERTRITNMLNDKGFFKFVEEYIHYKVDTTLYSERADIKMVVENEKSLSDTLTIAHKKYKIVDYSIFIDKQKKNIGNSLRSYSDTTYMDDIKIHHNGKLTLNKSLFLKSIEIKPGELYTKKKENKTYNNLYTLRQFKYVKIQFLEDSNSKDSLFGYLHGNIFLPLQIKQNYSIDIEGTNTSDREGATISGIEGTNTSANFGVAGNINYQHRNLLGGAEVFDFTIKGGTERQLTRQNNKFNTKEFGSLARLTIPGILFPIDEQKLHLYSRPFTLISLSFNYQERPDYTRSILNATLGYKWKSSPKVNQTFNLLDLNAVQIDNLDQSFSDQIKDLFIKSSYTPHIISSSSYSFTFNDQVNNSPAYHFFRMNIEAAGNILWGLSSVLNREKILPEDSTEFDQSPFYQYLGTRYAQYIKGDFDFRYGYRFDKFNSIATRAFAGLAFPYGNFKVIPFEKRYFTGGANGIRAWQVRSLGPGSYAPDSIVYPNQSSDIKLEANIEYRFKLFWMFQGAFFIDAGNIWAINSYDNRQGAVFLFDSFYKEFAVGTGFGLRLVSPYFTVRADLGMKLRDPSLPDGNRWIPQSRTFNSQDFNLNIAIGYPF